MKRFICEPAPAPLSGTANVPGDKSISHRSLIFAGLGQGCSIIEGLSSGEDNRRTLTVMAALGATFDERGPGGWQVGGVGVDGLQQSSSALDCGNSGTSIRLLAGLLAGQSFESHLVGDQSLSQRPMNRIAVPLRSMGASVAGETGAIADETYAPLVVCGGQLEPISYDSPIASAQVKSAVLLAGLYAGGVTRVTEPKRSRDHTERMLTGLGVPVRIDDLTVILDAGIWDRRVPGQRYVVPGDPSAAAFIVVAALVAGASNVVIENVCANPTRTGYLDALALMGAKLRIDRLEDASGEPVCRIAVSCEPGGLRGQRIEGELTVRAIDEIPILAIAAANAEGTTEIRDGAELRVKESDRIASTAAMLRALGIEVEERRDGLLIGGRGGQPLDGAVVEAHGDHRIAMAAAVAATHASGEVTVNDVANVATSFPSFAATMNALGARIAE